MSSGMILTKAGRTLLAKALTGKVLKFTKAMCGDGKLGSKDVQALTDLISPKRELPIQSMSTSKSGTAEVSVAMTNKNLSTGFFVREYGLFAEDPDTNQEVLYAYSYNENANYLEGDNGIDLISYTLSLVTVIDQAKEIHAVIENSNNYVTVTRLDSRIQDLFADYRALKGFWTYAQDDTQRLRPVTLSQARNALIGTYDIANLSSRIEVLEDTIAQTLLELEMQKMFPGYTHFIIEDFKDVNQIDQYQAKVTSVITGDDSIDCEPVDGMLPGSWYTLSDGINSERVLTESISLENGIQRVILTDTVKNTYTLSNARIYRTSADIGTGRSSGAGQIKTQSWTPSLNWSGISERTSFNVDIDTSVNNQKSYVMSGRALFDSESYITLGE